MPGSSSQTDKLVELVGGEKVAVSRSCDSDDEDRGELEGGPPEGFTLKLLFMPSHKSPTLTSGNIVYATTAIICKCPSEKALGGLVSC